MLFLPSQQQNISDLNKWWVISIVIFNTVNDNYSLKYNFKKSIIKGFYFILIQAVKIFLTVQYILANNFYYLWSVIVQVVLTVTNQDPQFFNNTNIFITSDNLQKLYFICWIIYSTNTHEWQFMYLLIEWEKSSIHSFNFLYSIDTYLNVGCSGY